MIVDNGWCIKEYYRTFSKGAVNLKSVQTDGGHILAGAGSYIVHDT